MTDRFPNIHEIQARMRQSSEAKVLKFSNSLSKYDRKVTLGAISGMLMMPIFHASNFRLEMLAHAAASICEGGNFPRQRDLISWFSESGKIVGYQEDPAEDIFSARVVFEGKNYCVLEGLSEANTYHLQLVLGVVEKMPASLSQIKDKCRAILMISNLLCERARVAAYTVGSEDPIRRKISVRDIPNVRSLTEVAIIKSHDLFEIGTNEEDISDFCLEGEVHQPTMDYFGSGQLFRYPIIQFDDEYVVALPTGLGTAIRIAVIEECASLGVNAIQNLRKLHLQRQAIRLSETLMISNLHIERAPLSFEAVMPSMPFEFEPGYWVQLILTNDDLAGFGDTGLFGVTPNSSGVQVALDDSIKAAREFCEAKPGFKKGLTLIVMCGFGRGRMLGFEDFGENWFVAPLSAYDAEMLGWRTDFSLSDLICLKMAQRDLASKGFEVQHTNGLLAQVGDALANNGHLVPHDAMPDGIEHGFIVAPINSQLKIRLEYHQRNDLRAVTYIDGSTSVMRRADGGARSPAGISRMYCSPADLMSGIMRAAWVGDDHCIWVETTKIDQNTEGSVFGGFEVQRTWIERIAPVVFSQGFQLPEKLLWLLRIDPQPATLASEVVPASRDEIANSITLSVNADKANITTTIASDFWRGLSNSDNIAEAVLVEKVLEGTLELAEQPRDHIPLLLDRIVSSKQGRQLHAFAPQDFRDELTTTADRSVVSISQIQDGALRIGLGWSGVARPGGVIEGVAETTQAINAITVAAEDDLISDLAQFNLRSLAEAVARNHEAAEIDGRRWKRTGGAIIGLADDEDKVRSEIVEMLQKLNASTLSCRLLLEIGLHHCAIDGGLEVAPIDLSRLMARAMLVFHLGGYSDAIRYGAMRPEIRISPAGQIGIDTSFYTEVMEQVGNDFANAQIDRSRETYENYLVQPVIKDDSNLEGRDEVFESAFAEELGADFQSFRLFVDEVENVCMERGAIYSIIGRKDFLQRAKSVITNAEDILCALETVRRDTWKNVPDGFDDADRQPWRFRRRLSIPRRPIVRLGDSEDADLLLVPGMVRDGFASTVMNLYEGNLEVARLSSRKMRKWFGAIADESGREFEAKVIGALNSLGWTAESTVSFGAILGRKMASDLGDIDVLAWREDGRIILLECKHLKFAKTPSEVSKQLSKFRGQPDEKGKPDLMSKHLTRWREARKEKEAFERYAGISTKKIEAALVFSNTVPMQFAVEKMAEKIWVGTINNLSEL
ncbi:MAG: hypothetical protein AAF367_07565 [Pseudomonadota bacterium]